MIGDLNRENSVKGDLWSLPTSPHHWDKNIPSGSCRYSVIKTFCWNISSTSGLLQGPSHHVSTFQRPLWQYRSLHVWKQCARCVLPHAWPRTQHVTAMCLRWHKGECSSSWHSDCSRLASARVMESYPTTAEVWDTGLQISDITQPICSLL